MWMAINVELQDKIYYSRIIDEMLTLFVWVRLTIADFQLFGLNNVGLAQSNLVPSDSCDQVTNV